MTKIRNGLLGAIIVGSLFGLFSTASFAGLSNTSRSGVAVPNAKIRTPQQCLRACGRLKGASPDFCVASCL
jgi:hypothetical protein